ncbi:hypothetical protein QQS21_003609 [Conoideocrella luteorostrata]|uniref:Uncharacterized protein n=1 Tax=Conoideocrella luteorostrata TaxID=1105319 RepID=A0AAJ0CVZ6_9HYPO|nr:hypothetical protein QQS21_003609 [Conoideocrella luteorostrata]
MVSVIGPVSESNRLRETFRYNSALIAATVPNNPQQPIPASQLISSADAALTAFAQLAVLRLGASRALVSLFDSTSQHIVAEATPDISLRPRDSAAQYPLWLSGTSIPRSFGVCDHVLNAQPGPEHNKDDGLPVYVVNDLAQDDRFADRTFVKGARLYCRFFAGVPIRSRHGVDIGVFSVFGDEPRRGLEASGMRLMRELSILIMNHLEAERSSIAKRLSEHMIRGVGKFVDGSVDLAVRSARYSIRPNNHRCDTNSEATAANEQLLPNTPSSLDYTSPNPAGRTPAGTGVTQQLPHLSIASPSSMEKENPFLNATQSFPRQSLQSESSTTPKNRTGDDFSSQAWNIFDRASHVIRESMEIDGVVFLETKMSSGNSVRENGNWSFHIKGSSSSSSSSDENLANVSTSSDEVGGVCSPVQSPSVIASSIEGNSASHIPFKLSEKILRKLLRRYPRGNIFNFDEYGSEQSSDWSSEEAAPGGHEGKSGKLEDRKTRPLGLRSRMKQSEQEMLLKMLPGARCIAFAPVWDPQEQRWFAGSFAYTKTHTRVFTVRGDLSYLVAFGTVAMAEVCRLRATLADKSKMDMLSSLSHELRSPLHGMVLGVELLQDISLDRFQQDVLHTAETCGRTLLDTVNHLLDWAKINNLSTKASTKSASAYGRNTTSDLRGKGLTAMTVAANMISTTANVGIDVLAEEVVESVFAGHIYQKLAVARSTNAVLVGHDRNALRRLDGMQAAMDDRLFTTHKSVTTPGLTDVDVSLYIDHASSWMFHTQAGALRRVIMNLLGNSLKYTGKGFVAVKITQSSNHSSYLGWTRNRNVRIVNIAVSDSGRGISEEFLKNQLFVPFSQEDRMSPGVGLGLSLVKRIASALGGKVRVQSEVGQGTTVTVSLPLERPSASSFMPVKRDDEQSALEFESQVSSLKGLKIRLFGFNITNALNQISLGAGGQSDIASNLAATCRSWLSMHVLESPEDAKVKPDLILCGEDHLDSISANRMGPLVPTPIVVVCSNAFIGRESESKWMRSAKERQLPGHDLVTFISQPAGPRKLAKAFASLIKRQQEMIAVSIPPELTPPADTEVDSIDLSNIAIDESTNKQTSDGVDQPQVPTPSLPATPDPDPVNTKQDPYSEGRRFLLVDDNPINIKILSSCMDKMGLPHDTARDGKEAVDMFREGAGRYKCIFMDISMPVMDGFEATCLIRQQERDSEMPACFVIAVTGLASVQAQNEAVASGIDMFLTKPVKFRALKQILELRELI